MDVNSLSIRYLAEKQMMQLATVRAGKPWVCTVYFVHDESYNLYWLSLPTRRHSEDIALDSTVAVAIPVEFKHPVVGMQFEGTAKIVEDIETVKRVMQDYVDKYDDGKDFVSNFEAGTNKHQLYKFAPTHAFLLDEVHYPDGQRHEISF